MQPIWLYRVLDGVSIAAILGLGVWAWRGRRDDRKAAGYDVTLLVAWIVFEVVSLLRWTSVTPASQGRLIFPAIGAVALLLALGWTSLFPRRLQVGVAGLLAGVMLVMASAAPFTAIRPAYPSPHFIAAEEIPADTLPLNLTYGEEVQLLAYRLERAEVRPGESLRIALYWRALHEMDEDFSLYVQALGWDGSKLGQRDSFPAGGSLSTSLWPSGEIIAESFQLPITEPVQHPMAARIEIGLYRLDDGERLEARDESGQRVEEPALARVKVEGPSSGAQPQHPLDALFGGHARLVGYDLDPAPLETKGSAPLTLHWEALGSFGSDYTVFVQLLDRDGNIVAQGDGPPLSNTYPTSMWAAGERLADAHVLRSEAPLPPGTYQLIAGFYLPDTGERLLVQDSSTRSLQDHAVVSAEVRVP